jgi:hypothetical protein
MKFSHTESWKFLEEILKKQLPIKESWTNVIDFHENCKKKPYWTQLRQLNVIKEQEEINDWIENIIVRSPLNKNIVALWIGIVKLYDDNTNQEIYTIYLQGSEKFNYQNIEWAVDPMYDPDNKYAVSEVLNQMDLILKKDNADYTFLDWILPLAYCSLTLDEIIRKRIDKKKINIWNNQIHVVTGHDSGDYIELTMIE